MFRLKDLNVKNNLPTLLCIIGAPVAAVPEVLTSFTVSKAKSMALVSDIPEFLATL